MTFSSRSEFIQAQSSEKITLAHVEATTRLVNWTLHSGSIYKKTVPHFVTNLKVGTTALTEEAVLGSLGAGEWHYDSAAGVVYAWLSDSSDPADAEMVVVYRFFFADGPVTASWDLTNTGNHVHYEGRILSSPGFKHKIGVDQKLISTVGSGTLKLQNNDGGLDGIFDTHFFENQQVTIYNWNRQLNFSDAQVLFKGRITNKKYTDSSVEFLIKDAIFDLLQNVPQTAYTDDDTVNDDIKGRYKRWVYGRVDGLQLQSLDQIGSGYTISGIVSANTSSATLTGSGSLFLSQVSPGDTLKIGTQEFKIESVESNTSLTLDSVPTYSLSSGSAILVPEIPTTNKNRTFLITDHACTRLQTTVSEIVQFNRIRVADATGIEAGDFVTFTTGEVIEVKKVAPGNILVLRQNVIVQPAVSSTVTREPIQEIFIEGAKIQSANFTISNVAGECKVTLGSTVEYDIAPTLGLGFSAQFTNGLRTVTVTSGDDARTIVQPRDWIKPSDISYTTLYEVLAVDESTITLRTTFTDSNHTGAVSGRRPTYIGDTTVVSANVLGRTENGLSSGTWIQTGAQATKDLLTAIGVTNIDTASFTQGAIDNSELISLALPLKPEDGAITTKDAIDLLSRSTNATLTLNPSLQLKYKVLLPEIDDAITTIYDSDVISWSIEASNGDTIRNSLIRYRHQDVDRYTQESGSKVVSYSSPFVETYIGTNRTNELDVYVYNTTSASIMSHRDTYYRSLGRADVTIETDHRLEALEIGDQVILDFARLYKRLGDSTSRKKVCVIVGKTVTGQRVKLELTDMGNIFARSSIITPNSAADYSAATEEEKLKYGYITDVQGIVDSDEETANIHLIS